MLTKEFITGADINLKEHNLGIISQPIVDDFMYDFDYIDFVRPYYTGIILSYEKELEEKNVVFAYFLATISSDNRLIKSFYKGLEILYKINMEDLRVVDDEVEGATLIINKKDNEKTYPIAFISESNFIILCDIILKISKFEKPLRPKPLTGNKELIDRFKEKEREYYMKNPNDKNELLFENVVREVMVLKNITFYKDIKNMTVWQLRDLHSTENLKDSELKQVILMSSGRTKKNVKIKSWRKETKLKK